MGARLLHEWLVCPLTDRPAIEARLDAVSEFLTDHSTRMELRESLHEAFDLQRLTARISTGRANPRDLARAGESQSGSTNSALIARPSLRKNTN